MNASELRIGNWLNFRNRKKTGKTVFSCQVHYKDFAHQFIDERFEPMPITSKILEKAGFEFDDESADVYFHKSGEYYVVFYDGLITKLGIVFENKNCKDEDDRWDNWVYLPVNHKYVHQFQNLFHSLTSRELEIDL